MASRLLPLLVILGVLVAPLPTAAAKDAAPEPGKVHALVTAKHARAWHLFVPSKYSKNKSWPLVISSHGRGGSGAGEMKPWQALANSLGFIVACPDMVTATHDRPKSSQLPAEQEDDEVLMEIFETVTSQFNVDRRAVMITGFSGGGNPSYHSGLRHPEVFTHICTRGGNFAPQQIPASDVIERGRDRLQIYIFFGDADHVLIIGEPDGTGQAYAARDALAQAGYKHVTFEKVAGMKHESRPAKAAEWLAEYLEKNKKRFKEADKRDDLLQKARVALEKDRLGEAVVRALKAREAEEKHGLDSASKPLVDELEARGTVACDEAWKQHEGGDTAGALKALASLKRTFKGLPCADEAAKREKAIKDLAR